MNDYDIVREALMTGNGRHLPAFPAIQADARTALDRMKAENEVLRTREGHQRALIAERDAALAALREIAASKNAQPPMDASECRVIARNALAQAERTER